MYAKKHLFILITLSLVAVFGLSACWQLLPTPSQPGVDTLYTAAAQTVVAQVTLSAGETAVAQLTNWANQVPTTTPVAPATETSLPPTNTWTPPTATWVPPTTVWVPPTWTPMPPPPTSTPVPIPCNWAKYVADVTVPDGTTFLPGSTFTKIWRMRNIGSCSWNSSYTLIYVSGDRFYASRAVPLPGVVHPGNAIDLAVEMVAPTTPGHYRSYWMISDSNGQAFGIGPNANKPFWVDINVSPVSSLYSFDFALSMCTAAWRSSAGTLPCPGNKDSSAGSVILLNAPVLETGKVENEPTLWTRPEQVIEGWIMGVYPSYKIKQGDHFMADIGCLLDSKGCDVTFSLSYQIPGKPVKSLGSWWERYEGQFTRVDIDLTPLAGQSVQFILSVTTNGKPSVANAFWLAPSIRQVKPTPTPSPTPVDGWGALPAVQAAIATISQATGIAGSQFVVTSAVPVNWADSCLGIPSSGQVCIPVSIPGYRVIMIASGRDFEAHTNVDGSLVYWFEF